MIRFGKVEKIWMLLASIVLYFIGVAFFSYLQELPFYDLQSAKFPPSFKYGVASLLFIVISKYMEGKIKNLNWFISHIGKNAIFYYFGQGIGSSIIYFAVNKIMVNAWFFKWIIILIINIIITICVAEALAAFYTILEDKLKSVKEIMVIEK